MRTQTMFSVGLVISLAAIACGSPNGEATTGEDSQEVVAATANLKGSWVLQGDGKEAIELRPDGSFFRDRTRILNGVFLPGHEPGMIRDQGTFKVSGNTLDLSITKGQHEVFWFTYKAAPILNGVFLPGKEPSAALVLTRQPAPGSHVAFQPETFKLASSWCTAKADCVAERADKTWSTFEQVGDVVSCNVTTNACEASLPGNVSVEGGPCGDDVAIQKKCATGLTCVFPTTGPKSEHTPGTCQQ